MQALAPSSAFKRLAASRKPSQLTRALPELRHLERTLLMIEWYCEPARRRSCQVDLNKGEAAQKRSSGLCRSASAAESGTARAELGLTSLRTQPDRERHVYRTTIYLGRVA